MPITTLTSRELNQDIGRAKKATKHGPVFITDRGTLAQVLLSIEEYEKIVGTHLNIVEALSIPGLSDIEFEPPHVSIQSCAADLS